MTEYVATRWYRAPEVMLSTSSPSTRSPQGLNADACPASSFASLQRVHARDRHLVRRLHPGRDDHRQGPLSRSGLPPPAFAHPRRSRHADNGGLWRDFERAESRLPARAAVQEEKGARGRLPGTGQPARGRPHAEMPDVRLSSLASLLLSSLCFRLMTRFRIFPSAGSRPRDGSRLRRRSSTRTSNRTTTRSTSRVPTPCRSTSSTLTTCSANSAGRSSRVCFLPSLACRPS